MLRTWEKVYVFISSTFNDMHAERDYLVKRVFPELRVWCELRRLRLVDIDLRWGVTEQDALHNKQAVKVCLDRIDECRPFFLCFLGQRRGWVPRPEEISQQTLRVYPDLSRYAGEASVTEMEILHALVHPMHGNGQYDPAEHSFFYLRDPSYLSQLPGDPPQLRWIFTNEGIVDPVERRKQDQVLQHWRQSVIPKTARPVRNYRVGWNSSLSSPELALPMQCPSTAAVNIEKWRNQWAATGIHATTLNIDDDPDQQEKAADFNARLTRGRLVDFHYDGMPLSEVLLSDLKEAISLRFPDHGEPVSETELQREIAQQEYFVFVSSEGFIERKDDFVELDGYVDSPTSPLFFLFGETGLGKSMLLANWTERYRKKIDAQTGHSIHFRFVGASDRSTSVNLLLRSLLMELREAGKFDGAIPDDPIKLRNMFGSALKEAATHGKTVLVIDALNQLESGLKEVSWFPQNLPGNVKMIFSFRSGDSEAEHFYESLQNNPTIILSRVRPFVDPEDRKKLVKAYLSQYLKDLDESHIEALVSSSGAENPLYLKVVLSELRVFGAFANLKEQIRSAFGGTPVTAFRGVLRRLESDPSYTSLNSSVATPLLFGLMAHARGGLSGEELAELLQLNYSRHDDSNKVEDKEEHRDLVNLCIRQVRPFLALRNGRYDFFYEGFNIAVKQRYSEGLAADSPVKNPAVQWHAMIVRYLESKGDDYVRTLNDSVYHLVESENDEGIRRCFSRDFMKQKKAAGASAKDLQEDFQKALLYFEQRGDLASMFLIAACFRRAFHEIYLANYEGYLIWLGTVLAAADRQTEIQDVIDYIERLPDGPDRVRMTTEFLIGLNQHVLAGALRDRNRRELETVAISDAPSGLGLLAAEALGAVDQAFQTALDCPQQFPDAFIFFTKLHPEFLRFCRILKMVRRNSSHSLAPKVMNSLLIVTQKLTMAGPDRSVIAGLGMLPSGPDAEAIRRQGTDASKSTEASQVMAFLSNSIQYVYRNFKNLLGA